MSHIISEIFLAVSIYYGMRKQKNRPENNHHTVTDRLMLPKDILNGAMILTGIGQEELWIENYKGILEYTQESIVIQGKRNRVTIIGHHLSIDYYSNEDMKIIGCINTIRYE